MPMRGIRKLSLMTTSVMWRRFRDNPVTRSEFKGLVHCPLDIEVHPAQAAIRGSDTNGEKPTNVVRGACSTIFTLLETHLRRLISRTGIRERLSRITSTRNHEAG